MAVAYAALASLMHTIQEIEHHHSPPISLDKQQAQSLTQNITFLQGFLESYDPLVSDDESADPLAMSIVDTAYAAEDVIESHVVDTIQMMEDSSNSRPNQTKLTRRLFNCFHSPQKIDEHQLKSINFNRDLQQAIEGMDLIKKTAMSIDTAEKAVVGPAAASFSSSSSSFSSGGPSSTVVVGFKEASIQIMEKLIEDRPDLQVIPILGMGGIGKTTLATNVYEHKLIKEHFYICAWATISQQYNTRDILFEVFSQVNENDKKQQLENDKKRQLENDKKHQLENDKKQQLENNNQQKSGMDEAKNDEKKQVSAMSEAELGLELYKCLFGSRFLIVMDDMWSIDAWNNIQRFFPNNQNGSRILVTTRLFELSSQLNNNYSHQVGFLDEGNSWDLFSKTVFGVKNSCPLELKKIAKKIVDGCRGLPLSIVVVGGLLKKMDATQSCWESIGSNLTSEVNLENDKHCLRLLRLSYNHLPVHLKPCFLYVGVFEEDTEISVSILIKLWISEGFINPTNGEILITSARRLLKDLVDRNLVLISKLGSTGNIKSCKIHDLMRDLCLKECQQHGFYHVMGQHIPQCINNRQRRVVIPRNAWESEVRGDLRSMPHARSVVCKNGSLRHCNNLGLLRTFHAYNNIFWDGQSYKRSFVLQYVNLRHLTIKGVNMTSFFSSACLLWNLHTIIVSCSGIPTDPIHEIWKMPQLRHIEFIDYTLCLRDPPSVDDDAIIMENLRVLRGVRDFKCWREVVKRIPNIKKLKMLFTGTNVDDYRLISNIKFLCKLESISVDFFQECPYLNYLTFPHSLKRLSFDLHRSFLELEESMLEKMGSLPFLEKLSLRSGSFKTKSRWEIVEGQFPCLKYLSLSNCYGFEHWTAAEEESSISPCLEQISLSHLYRLNNIPREIGNIPTLQEIRITYCDKATVKSAKDIVVEQMEMQGDQLPFRVVVKINRERYQELPQSLSGPNFEVSW